MFPELKINKWKNVQVPVAHVYNLSYLGVWNLEDHNLRPAGEDSSEDPICKITIAKWTRGVTQAVEHLLEFKYQSHQKTKKEMKK
jgi:hypothetical protein